MCLLNRVYLPQATAEENTLKGEEAKDDDIG